MLQFALNHPYLFTLIVLAAIMEVGGVLQSIIKLFKKEEAVD